MLPQSRKLNLPVITIPHFATSLSRRAGAAIFLKPGIFLPAYSRRRSSCQGAAHPQCLRSTPFLLRGHPPKTLSGPLPGFHHKEPRPSTANHALPASGATLSEGVAPPSGATLSGRMIPPSGATPFDSEPRNRPAPARVESSTSAARLLHRAHRATTALATVPASTEHRRCPNHPNRISTSAFHRPLRGSLFGSHISEPIRFLRELPQPGAGARQQRWEASALLTKPSWSRRGLPEHLR